MTRIVATGVLAAIVATAAWGQPMRCGLRLINSGDTQADVLEQCGPPTSAREWTVTIPDDDDDDGGVQIPMAEWVYDFGPSQFVNTVVFKNGVVEQIKTGGYGD